MEDQMGESFDDVRVHTGPTAAQACESINARAFTVGNHVAFNRGEYDPESAEGQHVIAHELAHVRQQTDDAVSMLPKGNVQLESDSDPKLEEEVKETAQRVMAGGQLDIQRMKDTEIHIQRSENYSQNQGDQDSQNRPEQSDVTVDFPDKQLQKKFKHSDDFGIDGSWGMENKEEFRQALQEHINDPDTIMIEGEFRGEEVTHYYNQRTGNNLIVDKDGEFISGWELTEDQQAHLTASGKI